MKILLIGPYPPPHGGISVHVMEARNQLERTGAEVRVLNSDRGAPTNQKYVSFHTLPGFITLLLRHAIQEWIFHVHTNGHNTKSWLLAFLCGFSGKFGRGSLLTLHSGMTPSYLKNGTALTRLLARRVCKMFDRIVAVNSEIYDSLIELGVSTQSLEMLPAYLATSPSVDIPSSAEAFLESHWPIFSTVLFFRPEYGVEFLLQSLTRLRETYPKLGCLLLGSAERSSEARLIMLKEGLDGSILVLGDLPHDLCIALISRSDAFLRCTFADGDSTSVREAIQAGVPVVASAVGYRPTGTWLFPPGDTDSFIAQVVSALGCQRSRVAGALQAPPAPRLIEIYQKLQPENIGS